MSFAEDALVRGKVTRWGFRAPSKADGHVQLEIEFSLEGEVDPNSEAVSPLPEDAPQKARVFRSLSPTEGARNWLYKDLAALGYENRDLRPLRPDHPEAVDLSGREVTLRHKISEYMGKPKTEWRIEQERREATAAELDLALALMDGDEEYSSQETVTY